MRAVFQPSFAMQSWSLPLAFSGLTRDDTTGKYDIDKYYPLRKILGYEKFSEMQNSIRLNSREYRDSNIFLKEYGNIKISVKMHDKIFIFPKSHTAFLGTSFNPSAAAEGNQEQLLWIKNHPLVTKAIRAFESEFERANTTVREQAKHRNTFEKDMSGKIVTKDVETRKVVMRATRFAEQDTTTTPNLDIVSDNPKLSNDSPELEVRDILKSSRNHNVKACGRFYRNAPTN